jgi:gluconolactonase
VPLRRLQLSEFKKVGLGIPRPEGVAVSADGRAFASHHFAGVGELLPDGGVKPYGGAAGAPNGLAFDREGRVLIANFGIFDGAPGPLERLDLTTGERTVLVGELEGRQLTSCNVVVITRDGTIYCSHSTYAPTWPEALDGRADGFVFIVRPDGKAEIVARELRFPNGIALDADERYLYVTQTSRGDVVRFPILPGGGLGPREKYGPRLGFVAPFVPNPDWKLPGFITRFLGYTDGIAFDAEGNLWATLPAAHKLVAITPAGKVVTVAHDPSGELIRSPTNVCWGGPGLRDLYVADLDTDYVLKAESPVPGQPTVVQTR